MQHQVLIAGFGGQGILSTGQLLACAALEEGKEVAWLPAYGAEMRGGTASCTVTISLQEIDSPLPGNPDILMALNGPSLERFQDCVSPGGIILINSSIAAQKVHRDGVTVVEIPAGEMAEELGNVRVASNVLLGALVALTEIVSTGAALHALKKVYPLHLLDVNVSAIETGALFIRGSHPESLPRPVYAGALNQAAVHGPAPAL
ncbi:MAG: 2-oxoacid:acceptor oxidoreductase family protein [Peptococcaceae bacterium]|nr:2-oxoacid:acceptor oxidoreductase family protein [Peptococcaceae bacterium]